MRVSIFNVVLVLMLTLSAVAQTQTSEAQTWNIDPAHTAAQFSVRHLGISTVRGSFTKVGGSIQYDPSNPAKTTIDATIDAASVDTRVEMRDNDLRSPNFFDAAKYPTLTFKSKRVETAGAGKLKVTGDLTIHGVTKEVTLDVDGPSAAVKDSHGNQHMGASATTTINRKDFGVNGAGTAVGDDVPITIDMELVRPAPAS
jgi:polyisoprenoid-binding protein YceI